MSRIRVGVPTSLTRLPPNSSVRRIWSYGLDALADHVDVRVAEPGRRLRRQRIDVWLTDGHQGPLPVRRPVVAHFHEASWDDPATKALLDPTFIARYREPSRLAATAAAQILTVSMHSRREIVDAYGVPADRIHIAHNGVDHALHHPGVEGGHDLIAGAGGDAAAPYVLFVGTVHPRKNLDVLRAAMDRLGAEGYPHRLVLVAGPCQDRHAPELLTDAVQPIQGHPVVNLAGVSDAEVAALMSGASVLCQPSLHEGFGMPVAEAMACGTPVVTSDRGALPEVVGEAGIVVDPTVEGITDGLRRVLGDEAFARELADRSVEQAKQFTWERMAATWAEALHRALGATPE